MEKLAAGDPQRIGAYRLLARLGAGGMGQVYLARSDRGRTVAVKLVRKELAAQDEFRNRFRLEVAAARRVGGAWTAPVLDANTEAAVPWVATGYVAGPALQDIVSGTGASGPQGGGVHGPLPARSVRILGSGLAHALQDIHSAGLIHRDLKPSNVLVTIEGPKVIDFGIARAMETVTGAGLTRTGGLVGSPGFMAPEQVRGTQITPACDVFCLGSVLAYAATGRLPFGTADTAVHVLMFRIAQEEPDLSELPEGLRELVDDCLKKDPKERPTPAQILARVGEPDDDEPWLPGTLLAQLGSHAVQLLDHEEPGARTELAFSKRPEPPSEASVPKPPPPGPSAKPAPGPANGPASEPVPDPASIPPPPGGPGQGGGNGVHGMATMIGAGSPDAGPPPPAPQPPQPQAYGYPQNPQSPQISQNQQSPQPQLPPPPQQYGYPQPGQPPLPPWGATPPYGPGPAGYGYPSPYGPTPPYGPAAPAPQPEPRRGARGTVALIAVALVVALGAGGSVYAFMDSGSEKTGASDSQTDKTADDKSSQAGDTPSEDPPPATDSPSPSASEDAGPGDVPKKYLGSWSGTISGGAGLSTRELSIRQGEVGETVLELTAEGPTDTGGTYLCVFEAALGEAPGSSDGGPLRIGPSKVTEGRPMSSCTPGAATELTILPDGRLRRVTTSDGESVTYTKND
ncbi:serine/threonine-protein kinase [Streptomyces niveus]|uniref:Serine/threonine protein kinase n=1 Tax=Streptomyces niveus TaxID=193462 RepID=A0A1U9QUL0_STRNV|nr:serine/threonine-protein kinase [Streptomyces niveus]AQU67335.1 serine/threonine protein kinase [Streptomyces niveus]